MSQDRKLPASSSYSGTNATSPTPSFSNLLAPSKKRRPLKPSHSVGRYYPKGDRNFTRTPSTGHKHTSYADSSSSSIKSPRDDQPTSPTSAHFIETQSSPPPPLSVSSQTSPLPSLKYGKRSTQTLEDDLPEETFRKIEQFIPSAPTTPMPSSSHFKFAPSSSPDGDVTQASVSPSTASFAGSRDSCDPYQAASNASTGSLVASASLISSNSGLSTGSAQYSMNPPTARRRKSAMKDPNAVPSEAKRFPETRRQSSVRFEGVEITQPGAVSMSAGDDCASLKTDDSTMTEEEQLEAAIAASQQEHELRRESTTAGMSTEDIEEIKSNARNLRDASKDAHLESENIELLLNDCREAQTKINSAIDITLSQGSDVVGLLELSENLSDAIREGEAAMTRSRRQVDKKPSSISPEPLPLEVEDLVNKKDVFTLICTLRSQNNLRLDATLALMRFARNAEEGDSEQVRIRDEIRSSGGMHSLLTVFSARSVEYELKVVAAMAVSYLAPSFVEASEDIHASIALKIVECIRFLTKCRSVRVNTEVISATDTVSAATASLAAFWMTYLGPKLNSDASTAIVKVDTAPLVKRKRNGANVDQRRENIALREVLEIAVSLVIGIARKSNCSSASALVEQVCAVEIARPLAVREGILQVLVSWSESSDPEFIRTATLSLRYLTSIKDPYMAGWIHSEMVNKGAVQALAKLTQHPSIGHDVRLAIAQILASLCVAPHTRAAVVEANCIHFLVGFLYEPAESSSGEVILSAGSALVQLAKGAITRAAIFEDEDRSDEYDLGPQDRSKSLLDDILESGAIDQFVLIAKERKDKLRSIAIEGLRILSEDISTSRQTRLRLCKDGATASLGCVLKDIVGPISPKYHLRQAVLGLPQVEKKQLHEALCAVANILEIPQDQSKRKRRPSTTLLLDSNSILMEGCMDAAESGGLDSILKIASFPFVVTGPQSASNDLSMLEEACRSLSSMAPHLLTRAVAETGTATRSQDILNAMHGVLRELVNSLQNSRNIESVKEATVDLREVVLATLRVLAQSEPLMIRIVDKTLPLLTKMIGSEETSGPSGAVSQVLQSLDFAEDEIVSQVAGNNPSLLADWFCIHRSLLIQAMARDEIQKVLVNIWGEACQEFFKGNLTDLARDSSDRSGSDDRWKIASDFCEYFANDENTLSQREALIQQYQDIYGHHQEDLLKSEAQNQSSSTQNQSDQSLLACQIYPLNSCLNESRWILDHGRFLKSSGNCNQGVHLSLSGHVDKLMDTCFPSVLLRDQMAPISGFTPRSSYNFRALMMPQRRYFSFQREAKLLSRICDNENSSMESNDVKWSLAFTNSSFDEEFPESLVTFLYLCPVIRGLSFSRNDKWEKIKNVDKEAQGSDGSSLVASLAGSLPPWITHLTFVEMLTEDDLGAIVSILETVGKLTESQQGPASSEVVAQGKFSFLSISRSQFIGPETWQRFFGLFSRGGVPSSPRPLSTLQSLDLSYNNLGDDLCSKVLEFALLDESSHSLANLDLSGNNMRAATSVIRVLTEAGGKRGKTAIRTLKLASNNLSNNSAWLHLLIIFKSEAFRLRELDLSSNEIFLSTFDEVDTFVGSILAYKALVRLSMSNNHLHPQAIDGILRRLSESDVGESKLGFLEFENNDPDLTANQSELLQKFCSRSRRSFFESIISEEEPQDLVPANKLQGEDEEVDEQIADVRTQAFPDQSSLVARESAQIDDLPTPVEIDNVITVLFSAPLVYKDGSKRFQAFKKLNFEMERELMWQCLKEASRDIELSFDNATSERLLATVAKRCSCLHYSGHGHKEVLPFENNNGGTDWFPVKRFKELIQNESSVPFRFVFVSACHSGLAGETFASAGVPHVVCCQQEYELKDSAALAFTRQFYLALAVGNTVKESFEQGCRAVRATPNLRDAEEEMKKFVLLPRDGNHDVPIFNASTVREWPRVLSEEAKRFRRSSSMRGGSRKVSLPSVALRNLELTVRNLIQDDPSPTPPQFFLGREVEMYHVLNLVLRHRLISVVGEPGIGRSSLVCSLCHFLNERKNIMSTSIERIYFVKTKKYKKKSSFTALIMSLLKRLTDEGKVKEVDDEDDKESVIEAICTGLKKVKALLVFDRVERLEDTDDLTEFSMLLRELVRETNSVKILLTNSRPLGIPSLGEQHFSLGPLNLDSTVRLFAFLCPHVHRPGDRQKLIESLVRSKEEGHLLPGPDIPEIFTYLFDKLGRGIPSRIENAAFCFHKDELDRFKDGSFRDEF